MPKRTGCIFAKFDRIDQPELPILTFQVLNDNHHNVLELLLPCDRVRNDRFDPTGLILAPCGRGISKFSINYLKP
jgi:hypothetical protein